MLNDKDEIAVLKQVGARLREARELLGTEMTINRAAKMLGTNKSVLLNLEMGIVNNCHLSIIKQACELYEVSADFILGLSGDEWERDPQTCFERQMGLGLHDFYMSELAKFIVDHRKQIAKQDALCSVVKDILRAVSDIAETVGRFQALNPRFEEMPAGSQLLHRTRVLVRLANEARNRLIKCNVFRWQDRSNEY